MSMLDPSPWRERMLAVLRIVAGGGSGVELR